MPKSNTVRKSPPSSLFVDVDNERFHVTREKNGAVRVMLVNDDGSEERLCAKPNLVRIAERNNLEIKKSDGPWTLGVRILRALGSYE